MKKNMILLVLMFASLTGFSQNTAINTTGAAPNPAAGLDVDFSNMGLLIPRVALTSTTSFAPLTAHVAGMIVYNTATAGDVTPGFYYDNGTKWISGFPAGSRTGDMLYWNGSAWVIVPAGTPGQFLQFSASGIPVWTGSAYMNISTTAATAIAATTASSGGTIVNANGTTILSRGVCFATATGPTTANTIIAGTAVSPYTCNLTGLVAGTNYFAKAYAVNNSVTSYGNEITFSTLPTLTTTAVTLITTSSARTGGSVTTGNATVIERGICYGLTANPTTVSTKVIDPSTGSGAFISDISGLNENTLYYVRSYAINAGGTAYGTQVTFTTTPTLTTAAITSITQTTATGGGTINVGGNAAISVRGICWSTSTGPTTALTTKTSNGTGTGAFTSNLTPLLGGITYYVRAYATNAGGTAYGNEVVFTTSFLNTSAVCTVTTTTAISGGTISVAAGLNITERGIVYGINPGPTTADTKVTDASGGTGTFISNLTGLTDGTTYYIRAYAINNGSTFYGFNELSFTTGTPHVIGESMAGGKVIYVDCSGQHGVIGALVDQGTASQWGCYGTTTGATGAAIYSGLANTNAITALPCSTAGTAAQLCKAYTAGGTGLAGITDWYLPSKDEFQLVINQKAIMGLNTGCTAYGCYYWTSTELSSAIAYCIPSNFVSPNYNQNKNTNNYVRAVRAF